MFKVLIIDDEPDMCRGLSDVLEEEGLKPLIAHDGKTGLEKVENEQPDLVILDLRLPGMDGIQVLRKIREINRSLPVIMITGYGSIESAIEATKFGVLDYITKPFDNEKVVSLVRKTLQTPILSRPRGIMREELIEKLKIKEIPEPAAREKSIDARGEKKETPIRIRRVHILILLVLIGLVMTSISKIEKDTIYTAPYANPSEIMWDGKTLWSSDWYKQNIFKHNMDASLTVAKTYQFNDIHPIVLCWGGKYIWSCDAWTKKIYVHKLKENLSVTVSYRSPSTNPSGLAWDGENLWSCDVDSDKIYKHKLDNKLTVIAAYDSPSTNPSGLAWDGKNLWSCDTDSNKIYKHKMNSTLSVDSIYSPDVYSSKESKLTGITWDGKQIWTVDEGNGRIYKHNLFRMKLSKVFKKFIP
jgi:CheY-like chemotaxis protein